MHYTYHNSEDVVRSFDRVVCFYKGKPVYVTIATTPMQINVVPLDSGPPVTIEHDDPELDTSVRELGYMLRNGVCAYLSRNPQRQFRVGIPSGSIRGAGGMDANYFISKEFGMMLMNDYMSFEEALSLVIKGNLKKAPFHRSYAIGKKDGRIALFFKEDVIGYYSKDRKQFRVLPDGGISVILNRLDQLGVSKYIEGGLNQNA